MNYLSVENLSKAFGDKILFQNIFFGIEKGQKVALIAKNGAGKTTLMRILTGQETTDSGRVSFKKDLRVGFLDQNPYFDPSQTIEEALFAQPTETLKVILAYEKALQSGEPNAVAQALALMEDHKAWEYEQKIKQILSLFKVGNIQQSINSLSGGQRKRLALAKLLIEAPDFLLLDEPTNHLDLDMIEWLEYYLTQQQITLLMVTHDRYFLENICTDIIEIDRREIFRYKGNYAYFLEKKAERELAQSQEIDKAKNLYRKEVEWIRRQPKARGTKAKYRVDAFEDIKDKAFGQKASKEMQIDIQMNRLGKKIIEFTAINKKYGDKIILKNFNYIFKRQEKIGIVGKNGVGKSTFLNILTQQTPPDSGTIDVGETIVLGYYTQEGLALDEDKKVIEVIKDIAEFIPLAKGKTLSASQMLERFLFPPAQQYSYVSTLSGGEKRRLYLLTILMKNPNFLILDEPTNDLDIITLQILEDFLEEFQGCLIIVSHDRYFLDKLVNHLLIFEGEGIIKDYNGTYQEYREWQKNETKKSPTTETKEEVAKEKNLKNNTKVSYKEKQEYEKLEHEIMQLEQDKENLTAKLQDENLPFEQMTTIAKQIEEISQQIDQKTDRWLALAEKIG